MDKNLKVRETGSRGMDLLDELRDKWFNTFLPLGSFLPSEMRHSRLNVSTVKEEEDKVKVEVLVPGYDGKQLEVNYDDGMLTISGNISEEDESSSFKKSFTEKIWIDKEIDTETIKATCENGVLNIILDKCEKSKPKKIKIDSR